MSSLSSLEEGKKDEKLDRFATVHEGQNPLNGQSISKKAGTLQRHRSRGRTIIKKTNKKSLVET